MKKVLIVEDDPSIREFVTRVLTRAGHQVTAAENGAKAWAILESGEALDHIVSDRQMPEMDGVQLLLRVRDNPRTAGTPFILMTGGLLTPDLKEVCRDKGAEFLTKPFRPVALIRLVGESR